MTEALLIVGGLFLLLYVPLAVLAWRRPLLARFALRESTRRKGQFALLVLGLMAGSASITAALVGADSGTQTLTAIATQRLGAVDLTVTTAAGRSFPVDVANRLAADPALSPYVDALQAGIEVPSSVADLDQRLGKPDVLLVGFDPATQKRFGAFVLSNGRRTYGEDLAAGDVLLSGALSTALDARPGDHLRISTGAGGGTDLRVYANAAASGPGAYGGPFTCRWRPPSWSPATRVSTWCGLPRGAARLRTYRQRAWLRLRCGRLLPGSRPARPSSSTKSGATLPSRQPIAPHSCSAAAWASPF